VTADKKPGDAFYAFADALPSPPTMLLVTQPAERRPCAGWVNKGVGGWRLKAGEVEATVHRMNGWSKVFMSHAPGRPMDVESDDVVTVLLAAEDALRAVAAEILRAVGA